MELISVDCPNCGGNISEKIEHGKIFKCSNCGSTLVWSENESELIVNNGIRYCPECGTENVQNYKFCKNCGVVLTKTCFVCKTNFFVGDTFCPNGHNYENESQPLERELRKKANTILAKANEVYKRGADLKTVMSLCESALSIIPDLAEAYDLQGMVYEDLRRWDDAVTAYRNALRYDPSIKNAEEALQEIIMKRDR
jgi:tetratricopeptide (TPR) repeat protein